MASTEPNSDERERNGPHPLQNAFDALPLEVPEGAVRAAGRGLNAAGQAFEAGVRLAASGAGEIVGRAGDLAGDAARAGLDVASNVDLVGPGRSGRRCGGGRRRRVGGGRGGRYRGPWQHLELTPAPAPHVTAGRTCPPSCNRAARQSPLHWACEQHRGGSHRTPNKPLAGPRRLRLCGPA
jgi:hypothetical protein